MEAITKKNKVSVTYSQGMVPLLHRIDENSQKFFPDIGRLEAGATILRPKSKTCTGDFEFRGTRHKYDLA